MALWQDLTLIGVMIAFFYVGIIYILSTLFNNERLRVFAKEEFLQAISSLFFVSLFTALFFSSTPDPLGAALRGAISAPESGFLSQMQKKVDTTLTYLERLYEQVVRENMRIERDASRCYSLISITIYCGDWSLHGDVEKAHFLAWRISQLRLALEAERYLIEIVNSDAFLSLFIAGGILFRTFAPTRGLGALLLALGFGFYFIYPILYLGVYDLAGYAQLFSSPPPLSDLERCVPSVIDQSASFAMLQTFQSSSEFSQTGNEIAYLSLGVFLYQFIILAATVVFIRGLTHIFGGDAAEIISGISKIV